MILDGKIDLEVPAEKAWDFLIDINKFSTCLPGTDEVKPPAETKILGAADERFGV